MNTELEIRAADAARWHDLAGLLGDDGITRGCWCMFFRRTRADFDASSDADKRSALHALTNETPAPGLLAYDGDEPVGWCAVAPRESYGRIERSRVTRPLDGQPAWAITCLFTRPDHRGRGVADALVAAAVRFAGDHGATLVEAYPIASTHRLADADAYTGTPGLFAANGFGHATTRGRRSIWRRHLDPTAR